MDPWMKLNLILIVGQAVGYISFFVLVYLITHVCCVTAKKRGGKRSQKIANSIRRFVHVVLGGIFLMVVFDFILFCDKYTFHTNLLTEVDGESNFNNALVFGICVVVWVLFCKFVRIGWNALRKSFSQRRKDAEIQGGGMI